MTSFIVLRSRKHPLLSQRKLISIPKNRISKLTTDVLFEDREASVSIKRKSQIHPFTDYPPGNSHYRRIAAKRRQRSITKHINSFLFHYFASKQISIRRRCKHRREPIHRSIDTTMIHQVVFVDQSTEMKRNNGRNSKN